MRPTPVANGCQKRKVIQKQELLRMTEWETCTPGRNARKLSPLPAQAQEKFGERSKVVNQGR
jgi:hypothetical protein